MTNDLPSVGTEDGCRDEVIGYCTESRRTNMIRAVISERDELASRVRELTDDRDSWRDQCSQRVADWAAEHERVRELQGALQGFYRNSNRHDWPADIYDAATAALKTSKEHP